MSVELHGLVWALLLLTGTVLAGTSVGSMFVLGLASLTGPDWPPRVRRALVGSIRVLPTAAAFLLVAVLARPWILPTHDSAALAFSASVVSLATWLIYGQLFRRAPLGRASRFVAVTYLFACALTVWIASEVWLVSLTPDWGSSIFPLYVFAGFVASSLGLVLLRTDLDDADNPLARTDLQRLAFAFACLWAYAWYSQFMLVWYANQPHEAGWFAQRLVGGWQIAFYGALVLKWLLPFVLLFPMPGARSTGRARLAGLGLVGGQVVDLLVVIVPAVATIEP
jgi:hypothetical protein